MMTFETFKKTVTEVIAEYLPEEYAGADIYTEHVAKINADYTGLIVRKVGSNITPYINLDEIYSVYNDSTDLTFDDVLRSIANCIIKGYETVGEFGNQSFDFENIKDQIICSLVSYKTGEKLFSDRPYIVIENDIVVIFKIYMGAIANSEAIGTIPITNKLSESWRISAAELYRLALKNTPRIKPVSMLGMFDAMKDMAGELADKIEPEMFEDGPVQYIVSTPTMIDGAVALLFNDELKKISEKLNDDFYIIPSSIHELIVMPYSTTHASIGEMNAMIRTVNAEEVDEADVLTDHVFIYRKDKNMLLVSC